MGELTLEKPLIDTFYEVRVQGERPAVGAEFEGLLDLPVPDAPGYPDLKRKREK